MLSIVTCILLMSYGGYNLIKFYEQSVFNVTQTRQNYYFRLDESLSQDDGLAIAATVIGYDEKGLPDFSVDPEIGQLKVYQKLWDTTNSDPAKNYLRFEEVKMAPCSSSDGTDHLEVFYPLHESQHMNAHLVD